MTIEEFLTQDYEKFKKEWFEQFGNNSKPPSQLEYITEYDVVVDLIREYAKYIADKAFDAGSAYTIGSHFYYKQSNPNKEEFIKSLEL